MLVESESLISRAPSIFAQLADEESARLLAIGQRRDFAAGTSLWRQGDVHGGIYIIEHGRVRSFYISPSGREVTLAYWFPGNFVGGPDLFGDGLHMWCSSTDRPTRALFLPKGPLRNLATGSAAIAMSLLDALAFKAKCYSAMAQMLGTRSASERLQRLLVFLSTVHGIDGDTGILIAASFTHADLAALVGSTRQWVQMQIADLQKRGILHYNRGMLRIIDLAALQAGERARHLSGRG